MGLTISGASGPQYKPASQRWIGPIANGYGGNAWGLDGRALFTPLVVRQTTTFDQIGINNTVAGAASTTIRLGVYTNSGGKPGTLLVDGGTVVGDATGLKANAISLTLTPGLYWLCAVANGGTPTSSGPTANNYPFDGALGFTDQSFASSTGWRFDTVVGALPATAPAVTTVTNGCPSAALRVA